MEVFVPVRWEGYLGFNGTKALAAPCPTAAANLPRLLGLFSFSTVVRRSEAGESIALPVRSAMAAGMTTAADNLGFFDDLVAADEGEATVAALTEVVSPATAGPFATAAA